MSSFADVQRLLVSRSQIGWAGLEGPNQNSRKIAIETRVTTRTPEISRFTIYANIAGHSPGMVDESDPRGRTAYSGPGWRVGAPGPGAPTRQWLLRGTTWCSHDLPAGTRAPGSLHDEQVLVVRRTDRAIARRVADLAAEHEQVVAERG